MDLTLNSSLCGAVPSSDVALPYIPTFVFSSFRVFVMGLVFLQSGLTGHGSLPEVRRHKGLVQL
jgi:hypothetical protein